MFVFRVSSLRLAYKDLEIQVKDEKLNVAGKKKTEVDRLGMGFSSKRRYVESLSLMLHP